MKKLLWVLFLTLSIKSLAFDPQSEKWVAVTKRQIFVIDVDRFMFLCSKVESEGKNLKPKTVKYPDGKKTKVFGLYQIEKLTSDWMVKTHNLKVDLNSVKGQRKVLKTLMLHRIMYNMNWIEKYRYSIGGNPNDIEWVFYKIFWNSIVGKTTYEKWTSYEMEYQDWKLNKNRGVGDRVKIYNGYGILVGE